MYCIEGQLVASGQLLLAGVPGSHYRLLLDDFGYGSSGTKWRFGCPALNTSKCQTISDRTDQRISANCRTDPMGILQLDGLYLDVDNLPTTIIWGAARRLFRDPIQSQGNDRVMTCMSSGEARCMPLQEPLHAGRNPEYLRITPCLRKSCRKRRASHLLWLSRSPRPGCPAVARTGRVLAFQSVL